MKKLIYLLAFLNIYTLYYAQGATLTKEETINYINKKLKECVGHKKTDSKGQVHTIETQFITLSDDGIIEKNLDRLTTISGRACPDAKVFWREFYNPAHIIGIEMAKNFNDNEAVGTMKIELLPKTGKYTFFIESYTMERDDGSCYAWKEIKRENSTVDQVYLYYLKGDPKDFNKIKKALEYLRDLSKAEDDPFGE